MIKAEILSFAKGGEVIGTVTYSPDTGIAIETELDGLLSDLMGELQGRHGKLFSMHDGEGFVRELPFIFSGSYVRAQIVSDESVQETDPVSEG